jgi:hypothetical protein
MKLVRETLGTFLTCIPEAELPQSFKDAVRVARRLGVRYLWIDSLCIIQDSPQDWRTESSMMGRVYKNSLCNIAATASVDSNGGLFFDRNPDMIRPAVVTSQWMDSPSFTYQVFRHRLWDLGVEQAPLSSPGWFVQERFLAPRILHFTLDQIYWECDELQACETCPRGLPSDPSTVHKGKGFDCLQDGEELRPRWREPLPMYDGYLVWNRIVETYSRTNLSKAKDKLVAISALAKEVRQGLKDDYLAGLWRRHLGWELGWRVESERSHSRPSEYRCFSWSWASVDGQVYLTDYGYDGCLLVNVLEAKVTPFGDDDTGEIVGGFVRIQGPYIPWF